MPAKTIVQQPVTKGDLNDIHLFTGTGTKTWNAIYVPKDEAGAPIGEPRSISGPVTNDPGLWAWVDATVVAAINALEGT